MLERRAFALLGIEPSSAAPLWEKIHALLLILSVCPPLCCLTSLFSFSPETGGDFEKGLNLSVQVLSADDFAHSGSELPFHSHLFPICH